MISSCQKYEQQVIAAKEKVKILEQELIEINLKLKKNRKNIELNHELKRINIKMSTAVYELKHGQLVLDKPTILILKGK